MRVSVYCVLLVVSRVLNDRVAEAVALFMVGAARCPEVRLPTVAAVKATMDTCGGVVPYSSLLPELTTAGVPPVAVLRIVWALTKVRSGVTGGCG